MYEPKKNNRLENENDINSNSTSNYTKDLVDSTSENSYPTDVIPDEVERRDGPGGN